MSKKEKKKGLFGLWKVYMGTANEREPEVPSTVHDTGCGCYRCVIAFEPMAALLHWQYSADPEKVAPWPQGVSQ